MSAHSKTPYTTPTMDFFPGRGVARGRRGGSWNVPWSFRSQARLRGSACLHRGYRGSACLNRGYRGSACLHRGYRGSACLNRGYRGSACLNRGYAIAPRVSLPKQRVRHCTDITIALKEWLVWYLIIPRVWLFSLRKGNMGAAWRLY